ncbi:hypothetical protein H7I53_17950 [Mycolicibacterium pulveris]|uniref:Uncharacterized protein n=1 Tax=Mycolicibacterium pulveris TaxID=36813 RepID=A0A7I7UBQ9_MYCPV|nr:hypothetical protein [Mycolicibacterium pulveris]MCV6982101.1 hypothetical protein [Mycolicibacterium pulveris]BBY78858.1 hypothetical protein MPUL_00160 [Mycolicibacterium pulveris]
MPYEVVQYPRTDAADGTEVSVHWSKQGNGDHVQLKVERHVWGAAVCPNGCTERNAQIAVENRALRAVEGSIPLAYHGCSECPPFAVERLPLGSVRVSADGHIARKVSETVPELAQPGDEFLGTWTIWRREGDTENVVEAQILDWPVVSVPDDADHGAVPAQVFTDQLGRDEINALIRALRKARDQAYGADA